MNTSFVIEQRISLADFVRSLLTGDMFSVFNHVDSSRQLDREGIGLLPPSSQTVNLYGKISHCTPKQ